MSVPFRKPDDRDFVDMEHIKHQKQRWIAVNRSGRGGLAPTLNLNDGALIGCLDMSAHKAPLRLDARRLRVATLVTYQSKSQARFTFLLRPRAPLTLV